MTMLDFSLCVVTLYPATISFNLQWLLGLSLFVIRFRFPLCHYIFRLGSNLLGSLHSFTRKKKLRQQAVPAALCYIICTPPFSSCVWLSHPSCCTSDFVDIRAVRLPSCRCCSVLSLQNWRRSSYRSFRTVLLVFQPFLDNDADANCLFRQLNWKDVSTQFQMQKALMVCKSFNNLVPGYLSSKFVKRYETGYSLRDSVNKVIVPFPRTNFTKNSFSYSGAVPWKSLPCDMREAKSLRQFKRLAHLNFWLLKYCVHGIHEKQVI